MQSKLARKTAVMYAWLPNPAFCAMAFNSSGVQVSNSIAGSTAGG